MHKYAKNMSKIEMSVFDYKLKGHKGWYNVM